MLKKIENGYEKSVEELLELYEDIPTDQDGINYDADSSKRAWEYYKKSYKHLSKSYEIENPTFFLPTARPHKVGEERFSYKKYSAEIVVNSALNKGDMRLCALNRAQEVYVDNSGKEIYKACLRFGGETDFNFNQKQTTRMERILGEDYKYELELSKKMHHNILNFSLMQTMGNLQGLKGKYQYYDRFDHFLYQLSEYYRGEKEFMLGKEVTLDVALPPNKRYLASFLDKYENVYQYCEIFYLLPETEKKFVDRCIENGREKFSDVKVVKTYIDLAFEYWKIKSAVIPQKTERKEKELSSDG